MRAGTCRREARPRPGSARLLFAAAAIAIAALLAAGCGDGGSQGPYAPGGSLSAVDSEQQKQRYSEELGRMMSAMEDPNAEPLAKSIDAGHKKALLASALRWDAALNIVEGAKPPKDAKKAHERLLEAMRGLSEWNRKIAAAAPNAAKTKRIARQAQASEDAALYGQAIGELEQLGYIPTSDVMEGAGSPVE